MGGTKTQRSLRKPAGVDVSTDAPLKIELLTIGDLIDEIVAYKTIECIKIKVTELLADLFNVTIIGSVRDNQLKQIRVGVPEGRE